MKHTVWGLQGILQKKNQLKDRKGALEPHYNNYSYVLF